MGPQGPQGEPGVVDYSRVNEIIETYRFGRFTDYMAAATALDIDLPQDRGHRLTATGSRVGGTSGVGLGYAYMNEDGVALKAGVARAGGESVVKVGISFEFGNERKQVAVYEAPKNDDYNRLLARVNELEQRLDAIPQEDETAVYAQQQIQHHELVSAEEHGAMATRLSELEAQRKRDAATAARIAQEQAQYEAEQRQFAQEALADLEKYK
jgi:hypothetical protein